jgi:hypothetical protein
MRTKVALGATIVLVFLGTAVTLNRLDASAHVSHAPVPSYTAALETPAAAASPQTETSVAFTPPFQPAPSIPPQPVQQTQDVPESNVVPADTQVAASAPPRADPSTFGSEAYEPIYVN